MHFQLKPMSSPAMSPETFIHCQKFLSPARICSTGFGKGFFRTELTVKMLFCYSPVCYNIKTLALLNWICENKQKEQTNKILSVADKQKCFPCFFFFAIIQPERPSGHTPHCLITRHHISTDFVQAGCPRYAKNRTHNTSFTSQDNHNTLSQLPVITFSSREKYLCIEWQNPSIFLEVS